MLRRPVLALLLASAVLAGCDEEGEPDCPAGQTPCGGACRDTSTDETACGGCGRLCAQGATCVAGACQCPAGEEVCGTACVDRQTDEQNCGACGYRCTTAGGTPLGTCQAGGCVCDPGTSCPGKDPECRDLQTDRTSCGDCDTSCTRVDEICSGGGCTCPASKPDLCDPPEVPAASCVDLQTDEGSCGTCGHACAEERLDSVCLAGGCTCSGAKPDPCPSPTPLCTDLDTDPAHCGGCATACPAGAGCRGGNCACPASAPTVCEGACVNTQTSDRYCGDCDTSCGAGQRCEAGACCTTCPSGACQTEHSNGAGGFYHDCNPLGTYTEDAAVAAARSWRPDGTRIPASLFGCGSIACAAWQTSNACGIWCWGQGTADVLRGKARVNEVSNTCLCPQLDSPTWN